MDSRKAGAIALSVVSMALRIFGIFMCLVTVILCFPGVTAKLNLVGFIVDLSRAVPSIIAGYGVIASPFGGVFRFDFALVAFFCFSIDYACQRFSLQLREVGAR